MPGTHRKLVQTRFSLGLSRWKLDPRPQAGRGATGLDTQALRLPNFPGIFFKLRTVMSHRRSSLGTAFSRPVLRRLRAQSGADRSPDGCSAPGPRPAPPTPPGPARDASTRAPRRRHIDESREHTARTERATVKRFVSIYSLTSPSTLEGWV